MKGLVLLPVTAAMLLVARVESCRPGPGSYMPTYQQLMQTASLVLHGKDAAHIQVGSRTDSRFQVKCVLKNTNYLPVFRTITIRHIAPGTSCPTYPTTQGTEYIVVLRRVPRTFNTYEWDTASTGTFVSAAYEATPELLATTMAICGFQNPTAPIFGQPRHCPATQASKKC